MDQTYEYRIVALHYLCADNGRSNSERRTEDEINAHAKEGFKVTHFSNGVWTMERKIRRESPYR